MPNSKKHTSPHNGSICPNCQHVLGANAGYCSECGQKRTDLQDQSVLHLLADSLGDFFHFDSKFFRTIFYLIVRPGYLTLEFLRGRRARYFEPFKMFLFISIIYFIVQGLLGHETSPAGEAIPSGAGYSSDTQDMSNIRFTLNDPNQTLFKIPVDSLQKLVRFYGINRLVDINYPRNSWITRLFLKQMVRSRISGYEKLSETFSHTISKLIFLLIPLFALWLKVLYIRRKIPYYNHIIFSLHLISLVFLVLLADLFASGLADWSILAAILVIISYLYFALKGMYHQSAIKTLLKWTLFLAGSVIIIGGFFVLVASVSILLL